MKAEQLCSCCKTKHSRPWCCACSYGIIGQTGMLCAGYDPTKPCKIESERRQKVVKSEQRN